MNNEEFYLFIYLFIYYYYYFEPMKKFDGRDMSISHHCLKKMACSAFAL